MLTFGIGAIAAAIPTPQASATPSVPVPTAPVAGAQTGNAGPAAISGNLRRAVRNTIAAVGDSIIALGSYGEYQPWLSTSCYYQLPIMTHQRIRYGAGMFAVSGSLIQAAHDTQLPNVLAMNPLPGACILCVNTGSIANDSSYSFTTSVSLVKSMVASLLAAGVMPILWTVTPIIAGTEPSAIVATRTHQWNAWIRRYAALNGFALIDAWTALAQVDGTPISGSMYDTIHPNAVGHKLIAQQALADGLADIFAPNSLLNTIRTTDDLSNLFNNGTNLNYGLFTTDTNSDGVADGLSKGASTGTFALVAPAPSDELMGDWQQMAASASNNCSLSATLTGWSVGDTIAFSCRFQTQNVEASGAEYLITLFSDTPGGFVTPDGLNTATYLYQGIVRWTRDTDDGELYVEYQIPSAVTDLSISIGIQNVVTGSAILRVGEVTIRNLTTGGPPV